MYFLWKNTPYGIIRISCEGLYEFADGMIKSKLRLCSITLMPSGNKEGENEHADLTVVFSDDVLNPENRKKVERHFDAVLKPMGLKPSIVWAIPERGIMQALSNPYVWAGIASSAAIIITAGFAGFFWTVFWGTSAWFAVHGLSLISKRLRKNNRSV